MDAERMERLIHMAQRLNTALLADIDALERGKPSEMMSVKPEIQQLSAIYGKEAAAITGEAARAVPADIRLKLTEIMQTFAQTLAQHARLLTRMRAASEGMIRAIAEEVDRRATQIRPYGAQPQIRAKAPGAMIFNSVV